MEFRIREVAKTKGISLKELSERVNINYPGLLRMLRQESISTASLEKIAAALDCEVSELLQVGESYAHFYDTQSGEWLGIRKK